MTRPVDCNRRAGSSVPNLLTGSRVLMAVSVAVLFAAGKFGATAVLLCLAAVLTDALDGWLARRLSQSTVFGALVDPIADKILMAVIYGVIALNMASPAVWLLIGVIAARDVAVTLSRLKRYRRSGEVYPANGFGRVKMTVQSTAGVGALAYAYILGGDLTTVEYPMMFILLVVAAFAFLSAARRHVLPAHRPGGAGSQPATRRDGTLHRPSPGIRA